MNSGGRATAGTSSAWKKHILIPSFHSKVINLKILCVVLGSVTCIIKLSRSLNMPLSKHQTQFFPGVGALVYPFQVRLQFCSLHVIWFLDYTKTLKVPRKQCLTFSTVRLTSPICAMQRNRPDSTSVSSVLQLTSTFLSSSSWQAGSHGASRSASEPWPGTSGQGSSAMFQPCSEHHTWSSCSFISSAPTQPCTDSFTATSCQEWLQLQPVWKCHIREILLSFWLFLSCTCSSGNGSSNFETSCCSSGTTLSGLLAHFWAFALCLIELKSW